MLISTQNTTISTLPECNEDGYLQRQAHARSLEDPEGFWMEQALKLVDWSVKPTRAVEYSGPGKMHQTLWFADGKLNLCYNAVDRHVENGRGDQAAVIYDSPVTGVVQKYTFKELQREVQNVAAVLKKHGVEHGDTVLLYMAMVPQTLFAILACARLGVTYTAVFGGFASAELAARIKHFCPKVVLSNTCGLESQTKVVAYKPLLDEAYKLADYRPNSTIILQRAQMKVELDQEFGEYCWDTECASVDVAEVANVGCVSVKSNHPLYLIYTSGTTGTPKGIVRPSGPHGVALLYAQRYMYGLQPGETMFTFSDFGWALGHSYTAYGPLLNGSTTILFEGKPVGTPDAGQLYRVFSQHHVRIFLCAPTVVVILRRTDPEGLFRKKYDLTHMRGLFLAGERCTPEIHRWWISTITGKYPASDQDTISCGGKEICNLVSDHWWQTESGSPMTGICIGLSENGRDVASIKYGSAGLMMPGCDLKVIQVCKDLEEDERTDPTPEFADCDEVGNIVAKLPLPPGFVSTLWKADERFKQSYFTRYPGYYDTGDTGTVDSDGYVHVLSRTDDVIKVAAHRLSTSVIEEVVFGHDQIAECCVVARPCAVKGCVPMIFAALRFTPTEEEKELIKKEVVQLARQCVGPIVSLYAENIVFVSRLPKNRSGKILRKMIRMMIDEVHKCNAVGLVNFPDVCPVDTPATIEDASMKMEMWETIVDQVRD